tara:strand:+ start:1387 stop:1611 length:225 start_codon:yes stop_codon:yes gene_type:complete
MLSEFISKKTFSMRVEARVKDEGLGYIDAILALCEDTNTDPANTPQLLSTALKAKLEAEAVSKNYIKGGNRLPI